MESCQRRHDRALYNSDAHEKHYLRAITMIDPATGWFEVKDITDASANTCMSAFDDTWLSRYPRPQFIGFDNGNEYKNVFREMCFNYGIKPKPSTTYNPCLLYTSDAADE